MIRVVQRDEAEQDLIEAFVFIGTESVKSARLLLKDVEDTFNLLAEQPEMGWKFESKNPHLQNVRKFPVKGYPRLLVYYRSLEDGGIEVLRVLHGSLNIPSVFRA
jgi:plasmid stabilization system protein ParE